MIALMLMHACTHTRHSYKQELIHVSKLTHKMRVQNRRKPPGSNDPGGGGGPPMQEHREDKRAETFIEGGLLTIQKLLLYLLQVGFYYTSYTQHTRGRQAKQV